MGCRAVLLLKGPLRPPPRHHPIFFNDKKRLMSYSAPGFLRKCSTKATNDNWSSLPPPDVARLAQTARIRLAPHEVEAFEPKIRQVIDWFGQLQAVDLGGVEPAIRADTEGGNLREDVAEKFEEREAMIAAVPSYDEPYIKVPKVLNKE